jgi:RimJ/RimL family protein N-acetyltransferase
MIWKRPGENRARNRRPGTGDCQDRRVTSEWRQAHRNGWRETVERLRSEGWRIERDDPGDSPVQFEGRLPTGERFWFRAEDDSVRLAVSGEGPAGRAPRQHDLKRQDASHLSGPEGLALIRELQARFRGAAPEVTLVAASVAHLEALQADRSELGRLLGGPVPDGWPQFPEATGFTLDRLREHPDQAGWWMHFFLSGGVLVGSGGFVGPPQNGVVEFGYEIAPAFRGRGLGRAAARAMIERAFAAGVTTVVAHTLPDLNPSARLLQGLGFVRGEPIEHPEDGTIWPWRLPVEAWSTHVS